MKSHIKYLFQRLRNQNEFEVPKEEIEFNEENQELFDKLFPKEFEKLHFKKKVTKQQFEGLLEDKEFLISMMQLSLFNTEHYFFNNLMQYLINSIEKDVRIFKFVMKELPKTNQKFNQNWIIQTAGHFIDQILKDVNVSNYAEIIILILQKSEFDFELILTLMTTRLSLSDSKKITLIKDMHPLIYIIINLLENYNCELDQVLEQNNLIQTSLRHFFRDIIRKYAQSQKNNNLTDFIVQSTQQIPNLIDSKYCVYNIINIIVNEVANAVSYLQYEKKLLSSSKLKLIDLIINLQKNSRLYAVNFYYNFYEIKNNTDKTGTCSICLYEDVPLVELYELETNKLLIMSCRECFYTKMPIKFQDSSLYDEQDEIQLPTVLYGEADEKQENYLKFQYQLHLLSKYKQKRKHSVSVQNLQQIEEQLKQMKQDFKNLSNMHCYLPYYAKMSLVLYYLLPTYKNIQLILLAFLEDSSIQVRSKVLEHLVEYFIQVKKMDVPKQFYFSIFDISRIQQKIFQRQQDIAKQIRSQVVQQAIKIWNKVSIPCLELIVKRLADIEPSVRVKTLKACLENADLFKQLQQNEQLYFFEEVSKRLEEKGQIGEEAAGLIMLLLVKNRNSKDKDVADQLIELAGGQNNYKVDIQRLENLIEKLANNNEIIDKTEVLHYSLLRLVQYVKEKEFQQIENCLKLITILIGFKSQAQQSIAIKQIDNLMEITSYFLESHNEKDLKQAHILNGLFKILIFCFEEFEKPYKYEKLQFPLTKRISNHLDLLQVFIEKIIFNLHPRSPYTRSVITLSVLIDMKYSKQYQSIYKKLEIVIKLILKKSDSQLNFEFALIAFTQIFQYVEFFITKCNINVKEFFTETINSLYEFLQELSQQKQVTEEIVFAISKIWEKIPQLMFASQDFLKYNLETNQFPDNVIMAIYQIFYQSIIDANEQAQNQQFELVDKSSITYLIKEIFNITFKNHIFHPNPNLRMIVLKLIESLFENQLSLALHFGDYLIASLIEESETASIIIKKCIETRADHMLLQFKNGIALQIQHHTVKKPYFNGIDQILKNLSKQDFVTNSLYYDVCSSNLADYIIYLDEQKFQQKNVENYFNSLQFLLTQIIYLPYLSSREIKYCVKALLNRINDLIGKSEEIEHNLRVANNEYIELGKIILMRLFYAYVLSSSNYKEVYGDNIGTLRNIEQIKIKAKKKTKTKTSVQCYEMNQNYIGKFNEFINSTENNLHLPHQEVSDSDNEQEIHQRQSYSKFQKDLLHNYIDLAYNIFDQQLGQVEQVFNMIEVKSGVDSRKVSKSKKLKSKQIEESKQEEQNSIVEEQKEEKDKNKSKRKSRKSTKRKPSKMYKRSKSRR